MHKSKTRRVTLERITIHDTANFTQLFADTQDAKPASDHELGQDEPDNLGATLSKSINKKEYLGTYLRLYSSDEFSFCLNGSVDTQNVRIRGTERPIQGKKALPIAQA